RVHTNTAGDDWKETAVIEIELTFLEVGQAAYVGVQRHLRSLAKNRRQANGLMQEHTEPWSIDIEGAAAELAVARTVNQFWSASSEAFGPADVGGRIQVRWADSDAKRLIVHESDPDDHVFVFVVGRAPCYRVMGWIIGKDAKRPEWFGTPNSRPPCYWVPIEHLHEWNAAE